MDKLIKRPDHSGLINDDSASFTDLINRAKSNNKKKALESKVKLLEAKIKLLEDKLNELSNLVKGKQF